ncbi:alpha/beta fold hydrolase [Chloroflexota bacterium]
MKILKTLGKIILGIVAAFVALFALGYVLTLGEYIVPETVAQDPSLPNITIDGVTYHAQTFGDQSNPVVITLHGGPGDDYRSILSLQALADEYYVVFFDQRGTGLSPRVNPEEITIESAIADLDSIVNFYGNGEPVNLVGHSWGAMLASAYLGQYPDKVSHAVLAEPGFLTSEFAEKWTEETKMNFSSGLISYFLKTKFESLHVNSPDEHASDDYFAHQFNLYQGDDHPLVGYYCEGDTPKENVSWRSGTAANDALFQEAVDADGNFDINLVEGVEYFSNKVLFMTGECQTVIGADFQKAQMGFFPNAELAVIPDAGHEMFSENPEASLAAVRGYLNAPAQ